VTRPLAEWQWARAATDRFGLRGRLRQVASGIDDTFMLTLPAGERVAVRIGALPTRTFDALAAECDWITRLSGNDRLRVPQVCTTPRGERVVELSDGTRTRYACALSWISGRKIRTRFTPDHAHRLGAALAALHVDARSHEDDRTKVKDWVPLLCGVGPLDDLEAVAGPEARRVADDVGTRVDAACAALGSEGSGLVNRDVGPHNTVWDPEDRRPGLFDFNDTGWGPYAADLARYLHGLRWREQGERLVDEALDGYQLVAELPLGWAEYHHVFDAACNVFAARYYAPQVQRRGPRTVDLVEEFVGEAARIVGN
jgi:Ser/Thr protein kinase RdoA (MazF antagonist)